MSETKAEDSWILRFGSLGDRPTDSPAERLRHRLLIFMGVMMSGGGLLWGSIAASQNLVLPAVIPYGYTVLTVFNLAFFHWSKSFAIARSVQVAISLLLPFFFQWSLGGFSSSGGVMLWAVVAVVGSLTFSSARSSSLWLAAYWIFTLLSGVLDAWVREHFSINPPEGVRTIFFVVNNTIITTIVYGLMVYLLQERERATQALEQANQQISELNEHLEELVAKRTAELAASLARTRAVVDNIADGLVAVDREGRVQTANPAFSTVLGLPEDISGVLAADALPPRLSRIADEAMTSKQVVKKELNLTGERIGVAVASPILDSEAHGASCVGSVVILRDITLEKEIDRMKTDFIATVSHELRTPLTSVLGFAKLTKNKLEASVFPHVPAGDSKAQRALGQVKGNIDIIVSEGQRLTNLINDVLDISKMEAGRMEWKSEPIDPAALVSRAMEATTALFASGAVEFKKELGDELPILQGDTDRLLQVLINMISNAAKFTDKGSVTVRAKRSGKGFAFSVTDTGPGIAVSDQKAIFEKFKQVGDTLTNKPKGTGLGLPICKQIVAAHKGTITVESELGQGSTFTVLLPLKDGDSMIALADPKVSSLLERIENTVDSALPSSNGGDVLVVDDDASLRELLRQQLGEKGYAVRTATNGTEAIQQVHQRRPDVIILDVMMPDLSGFDVAAVLKADPKTQTIPIMILSIVQDAERGYRLGVDRYLTKPTDAEVLLAEVQRLMLRTRSPRRVLVVDPDQPAAGDVVRLLEAKGYEVVGTCSGREAIEEVRKKKPDLVIVETKAPSSEDVVRAIRMEKDLENIYIVQLVERAHGEA